MTDILDPAWEEFKRQWAVDGMSADKQRLARAAYDAGRSSNRKQVLLEAAERCGKRSGRYKRYAMNDAKKDSHWVVRAIGVDDCEDELRRMAEGEKG
jgi:hypothetical protein